MKTAWLFLVLAAGTIDCPRVLADDDSDADQVRQWVEQGRILSLDALLERHRLPGRLIDLEVEQEHGRIIYELGMMDDQGRVREIYLDAVSGELLGQEFED